MTARKKDLASVLMPTNQYCVHACMLSCFSMDCSPPRSSVHGILQARILEWVVISSSMGSPDQWIKPMLLMFPALAGGFFTTGFTWETLQRCSNQMWEDLLIFKYSKGWVEYLEHVKHKNRTIFFFHGTLTIKYIYWKLTYFDILQSNRLHFLL